MICNIYFNSVNKKGRYFFKKGGRNGFESIYSVRQFYQSFYKKGQGSKW